MLNIGQNSKCLVSILISHGLFLSCKKLKKKIQIQLFKKSQKWFARYDQNGETGSIDLAPPSNQSFQETLKASITCKIMPNKKKFNEAFLRYFQKSQFLCSN